MKVRFAQKAVILRERELLLVRKSDSDPHNPNLWELPGGGLQADESLDDALRREVWEEVGLKVTPGRLVHMWEWNMPTGGEPTKVVAVARFCEVEYGTVSRENNDADDFISDARWIPLSTALDLPLIADQEYTIKEVANLLT
jgi:8-oxo-dGTP pyrophosphatase MutT (NUDIX family)